jgi:hypothetical protein
VAPSNAKGAEPSEGERRLLDVPLHARGLLIDALALRPFMRRAKVVHSSPAWPQPPSSHDQPLPAGSQRFQRSPTHCPRSKSWRRSDDRTTFCERWIPALCRISTSKHGGSTRRHATSDVKEVAMKTESNTEVHRWRAFAVLAVAYFMTIIDLTIVNVA